jgi:hypothetical protein
MSDYYVKYHFRVPSDLAPAVVAGAKMLGRDHGNIKVWPDGYWPNDKPETRWITVNGGHNSHESILFINRYIEKAGYRITQEPWRGTDVYYEVTS